MADFTKRAVQTPFLMITGNRLHLPYLVSEDTTKSKRLSLSMTAISIMILQADKWTPLTSLMRIRQLKEDALVSTSLVKWAAAAMLAIGKVASRVLWLLPTRQPRSLTLVVQIDPPSWIPEDWTLTQHLIRCHMVIRLRGTHFFESYHDQQLLASQWRRNKVQ